MNIIIVGCGKVGGKIAEKLSRENAHNITVVDTNRSKIEAIINDYDIMGIAGSCTDVSVLEEAGVKNADILIAITGSDELNLLTCLMATKVGKCQTIARVRKPDYRKILPLIKDDLGLAMIINPEQAAAAEAARVLRFPSAIQIDTFAKGRVEILKFKIPENSPLDDLSIADMSQKIDSNILVCGVVRGDEAIIPGGDFVMKSGDFISIVSAARGSGEFFRRIGVNTNRVKDTVIVGGGDTGYYLASALLSSGIKVKIIERDQQRSEELAEMLPAATVINADGTEKRVLLEEGIEFADSFVSLTNIDEENVLLSLFAKSKMKGKLITKINRIDYDEVVSNLDLDTIIYPKNITAEYIVKFVRAKNNSIGSNIETMHSLLDGKAEALEFKILENSPVAGIPIEKLDLKDNIIIACISRGTNVIIPRGRDVINPGDNVIVVTKRSGFTDIADILR